MELAEDLKINVEELNKMINDLSERGGAFEPFFLGVFASCKKAEIIYNLSKAAAGMIELQEILNKETENEKNKK